MKSSGGASSAGAYDSKSGRSAAARGGAGMSGNSEQVKAIQQALKDQGHDPGEIDGIMGPKTQAALRDYQQKQGLKATGRLDSETSAKLGVEAKTSAAPSSSSSSPAASPSTGSSSAPASSDTKSKADTGMKSDSSTTSDSATKPGKADTSAKPSDNKQK